MVKITVTQTCKSWDFTLDELFRTAHRIEALTAFDDNPTVSINSTDGYGSTDVVVSATLYRKTAADEDRERWMSTHVSEWGDELDDEYDAEPDEAAVAFAENEQVALPSPIPV